jgi:hypothetical protein
LVRGEKCGKENKLSGLNKIPSNVAMEWDESKKQRGDLTRMKRDGKKAEEGKKNEEGTLTKYYLIRAAAKNQSASAYKSG